MENSQKQIKQTQHQLFVVIGKYLFYPIKR